jgi:catechol 2,3-dioxygenase-like lactoylglutathione lyase family enzyme
MRTLGLDHVSLTVADLDRSLAFYHNLLGIPILGRGEETASGGASISGLKGAHFLFADLDLGTGQILELLQYLRPKGTRRSRRVYDPGSGHVGLRVDDLRKVLSRARRSGFEPRAAPVVLEDPVWWRGATCVYLVDPDGVTVELVQRPKAAAYGAGAT